MKYRIEIYHLFYRRLLRSANADEIQMLKPPEATRHHNSRKLLILPPHRAIQTLTFQYETTCSSCTIQGQSWVFWLWVGMGFRIVYPFRSVYLQERFFQIFRKILIDQIFFSCEKHLTHFCVQYTKVLIYLEVLELTI